MAKKRKELNYDDNPVYFIKEGDVTVYRFLPVIHAIDRFNYRMNIWYPLHRDRDFATIDEWDRYFEGSIIAIMKLRSLK